jgi:hypothetical protein
MDSLGETVLILAGFLLAVGGLYQILFRGQVTRDRQRSYDPGRWWAYPSLWQEHAITLVAGLLMLAFGICLILVALLFEPLPE